MTALVALVMDIEFLDWHMSYMISARKRSFGPVLQVTTGNDQDPSIQRPNGPLLLGYNILPPGGLHVSSFV